MFQINYKDYGALTLEKKVMAFPIIFMSKEIQQDIILLLCRGWIP